MTTTTCATCGLRVRWLAWLEGKTNAPAGHPGWVHTADPDAVPPGHKPSPFGFRVRAGALT